MAGRIVVAVAVSVIVGFGLGWGARGGASERSAGTGRGDLLALLEKGSSEEVSERAKQILGSGEATVLYSALSQSGVVATDSTRLAIAEAIRETMDAQGLSSVALAAIADPSDEVRGECALCMEQYNDEVFRRSLGLFARRLTWRADEKMVQDRCRFLQRALFYQTDEVERIEQLGAEDLEAEFSNRLGLSDGE